MAKFKVGDKVKGKTQIGGRADTVVEIGRGFHGETIYKLKDAMYPNNWAREDELVYANSCTSTNPVVQNAIAAKACNGPHAAYVSLSKDSVGMYSYGSTKSAHIGDRMVFQGDYRGDPETGSVYEIKSKGTHDNWVMAKKVSGKSGVGKVSEVNLMHFSKA